MSIIIFDQQRVYDKYTRVGLYMGHPIYVGVGPPKEWVATATDDGLGVCVNSEAYAALRKSSEFLPFLECICEHEIANGPVHDHPTPQDNQVIRYLRQEGILEP